MPRGLTPFDFDEVWYSVTVYVGIVGLSSAEVKSMTHVSRVLIGCFLLVALMTGARAETKVDIALVLAVDVSLSIDDEEFALQRAGYAAAFRNPRVIDAITAGGTGTMAVTYIQWSGATEQQQIIGWRVIRDEASAVSFAGELAAAGRLVASGSTSLSGAIDVSARLLRQSGFAATRRVIDISGDGYNNSGRLPIYARDEAVAEGITINGLAILKNEPLLEGYYERNVMGGQGAFVLTAADFGDFAQAILGKLVREVAELAPSRPLLLAESAAEAVEHW
jgi:hypothetical protein